MRGMMGASNRHRWGGILAAALPLFVIVILLWPNLLGRYGLGTETVFDSFDPIYGDYRTVPPRQFDDGSPVQVDWPRDRRLRERVRAGHFDLWDPVVGNGVPLPPDQGGVYSPLRLILYAAPFSPYTSFVLFRVFRLVVAALGAYLLGRRYGLSRPAGAMVATTFGLSGGMISLLPFATPMSVCWLPWICWAQIRAAQDGTWRAAVPQAAAVAALALGGHQPIIGGMMMGGVVHALGVVATRPTWRLRGRTALIIGAGYFLGACIAAPSLLATAELVRNGHSYKASYNGKLFFDHAIAVNRMFLFPGAIAPHTIDALRSRGASYPYSLHFVCGVITYLLAAVAVVWRRWRTEWVMLFLFGICVCFQPPGFAWTGTTPFIKDILPRYIWALCVLPLCVAAGAGLDSLAWVTSYRRNPIFSPRDRMPSASLWPRSVSTTTLLMAGGTFCLLAACSAVLMWSQSAPTAAAFTTLVSGDDGWTIAVVPLLAACLLVVLAVLFFDLHQRRARWVVVLGVCVEMFLVASPHVRDPASALVRRGMIPDTDHLAAAVSASHGRVGGSSAVTIGLPGWRELRLLAPLVPLRYARFLEAAAGPIMFTTFNLPTSRSALADLAAVEYLLVPRSADPFLEADPRVTHFSDIKGVSVYKNLAALPRARVVHRTLTVASTDAAVAQLANFTSGVPHVQETPLDGTVILEPLLGEEMPLELAGGPPGPATFLVDEPDQVVVKVTSTEPGYVVLADTHYPGWVARVDGQSQPIYPANVGFRAVYVGAGTHTVDFRYQPLTFRLGMLLLVFGCLACAALLWATRPRIKRSERLAEVLRQPALASESEAR